VREKEKANELVARSNTEDPPMGQCRWWRRTLLSEKKNYNLQRIYICLKYSVKLSNKYRDFFDDFWICFMIEYIFTKCCLIKLCNNLSWSHYWCIIKIRKKPSYLNRAVAKRFLFQRKILAKATRIGMKTILLKWATWLAELHNAVVQQVAVASDSG